MRRGQYLCEVSAVSDVVYYGAAARASALIAGYSHWMDVTRWPIDDEDFEDAKIYD